MYKAIHRIEMRINDAPIFLEPGSVVNDVPNAEELLEAGAIIRYEAPELQVVPVAVPEAKKGKKADKADKAADAPQDFG